MFMCFLLVKGSSNEGDIICVEETFAYVGWDVGIPGQFAVASDVDASESHFSVGRISEPGAIDLEYSASHRVRPESKGEFRRIVQTVGSLPSCLLCDTASSVGCCNSAQQI